MITQGCYTIAENRLIAERTYLMSLAGDTGALTRCGQFVNIKLDGFFLRRPISVCDWREGELTLIYKTVGDGTRQLSKMRAGESLSLLCGLGNGFDTAPAANRTAAVVGGGVGVPPLYALAKRLVAEGGSPYVVLGFNTASQAFFIDEFKALGLPVAVTTADGSLGIKGFVTDALRDVCFDYYFACGPMPMLRAVHACGKSGQLSFEERMGCGFGACMGCSCQTLAGNKRICVDGPVMLSGEVRFDG